MNTSETQQVNMKVCEIHKCVLIEKEWFLGKTHLVCQECEDEDKKKSLEEDEKKRKESLVEGIPKIYHGAILKEIKGIQKVMDWLSKRDGFLYIYGACGCGKTHLSCAIKRRANELRLSCSLFFSSDIFLRIRKSFDNGSETESSIIDLCAPEYEKEGGENFAIFDDFGNQKITDYAIETWYNIINRRYMNGYPTIFTSNLSLKEISVSMTDRIASRLASGIIFEMKGNDRRLIKRDLTKVF